jgi:ATP-dependent DNA ligase
MPTLTVGVYAKWFATCFTTDVTLAPIAPMAATVATTLLEGALWSYEVKWDGYRAMVLKDARGVRLISRNLHDLTADYPQLAAAAAILTR